MPSLGYILMVPSMKGEQSANCHCTCRRCGHMPAEATERQRQQPGGDQKCVLIRQAAQLLLNMLQQ